MNALTQLKLVPPPVKRPWSILSETCQLNLERFNALTRDMREAGIPAIGLDLLDNCIVIEERHGQELARRFGYEIRMPRTRCFLGARRHIMRRTVTIRDIDVVWFVALELQA